MYGDIIFKIPGHFRKWGKGVLPHFSCTITIDNVHHIRTHVLLDTGSPFTPITPKDYMRTRLRVTASSSEPCYLAACKFSRIPVGKDVVYKFQTDDNKLIKIGFDGVIYLVPTQDSNVDRVKSIPSILGIDFIRANGLRFVTEPHNDIAYIEGDLE